jgi:hypothetical protein
MGTRLPVGVIRGTRRARAGHAQAATIAEDEAQF